MAKCPVAGKPDDPVPASGQDGADPVPPAVTSPSGSRRERFAGRKNVPASLSPGAGLRSPPEAAALSIFLLVRQPPWLLLALPPRQPSCIRLGRAAALCPADLSAPPTRGPTVLYRTLEGQLEAFLARASDQGGGDGLPAFVTRELRADLRWGRLEHGCVHVKCERCGDEMSSL